MDQLASQLATLCLMRYILQLYTSAATCQYLKYHIIILISQKHSSQLASQSFQHNDICSYSTYCNYSTCCSYSFTLLELILQLVILNLSNVQPAIQLNGYICTCKCKLTTAIAIASKITLIYLASYVLKGIVRYSEYSFKIMHDNNLNRLKPMYLFSI